MAAGSEGSFPKRCSTNKFFTGYFASPKELKVKVVFCKHLWGFCCMFPALGPFDFSKKWLLSMRLSPPFRDCFSTSKAFPICPAFPHLFTAASSRFCCGLVDWTHSAKNSPGWGLRESFAQFHFSQPSLDRKESPGGRDVVCCGWARDGGDRVQTVSMSDSGDPSCLPERCVPWTAMPELGSSVVVSANHEMLSHFPLNSSCDRVIVWPALK